MAERKIIHVDMDAFFASVEQHDNPDLKGRPIAVGHDAPRSVVATASYEARKFGVHSAQPMAQAKRRCEQLVIVEPHFARYREVSAQVHEIFHRYTDIVEPISVDEAFLDVTENKKGITLAMDIAKEIRQAIWDELHLTASAGVSCNKLLAKIASDFRKPNGLTVVHPQRIQAFLQHLPVENLWGVGPKTKQKMYDLMVHTCGQLREVPLEILKLEFGKMGQVFYDFARGIDNRPVVTDWIRKSVGCEETFESDISKPSAATKTTFCHWRNSCSQRWTSRSTLSDCSAYQCRAPTTTNTKNHANNGTPANCLLSLIKSASQRVNGSTSQQGFEFQSNVFENRVPYLIHCYLISTKKNGSENFYHAHSIKLKCQN